MVRDGFVRFWLLLGLTVWSASCSDDPAAEPPVNSAAGPQTSGSQGSMTGVGGTATSGGNTTTVTSGTPTTIGSANSVGGGSSMGAASSTGMAAGGTSATSSAGGTGNSCGAGQADCGAGCIDVLSDPANCGSCGKACPGGSACTNGECPCATLTGPVDRGAGSYVLEFGDTYFAVQAAGGKIVEFRRASGSNLLTTSAVHELNFGSTLWTAPQSEWDWPPPTALDSEAYTVTVDEAAGVITMTSNGMPSVGPDVTVTKVFSADLCGEAIDISYSVANNGAAAIMASAWEVTRVLPGGLSFFAGPEALLTGDPEKTPLVTQYLGGAHWFDHAQNASNDDKTFAEASGGYIAFTQGMDLFVRSWSDVTAHPPEHGEVELYDGTDYVELEVLGEYGAVGPNPVTLDMRWLVRPMPEGAQRVAGDATLLAAVEALLTQ